MKTWATLRTEIKNELNLNGEDFVSDLELLAWANDGIEQAEKEIVSLYDKYFETDTLLPIVSGTALYALPADILASKITHIEYKSGSHEFEVEYLKTKDQVRWIDQNGQLPRYRYRLRNDSTNGRQIEFFPTPVETSSTAIKVYYIRRAKRLALDADVIDVPIADAFVKQWIKDQVRLKEVGPISNFDESPALARQRALMIEALQHMIPDDTRNQIIPDVSFYDDVDEYDYV